MSGFTSFLKKFGLDAVKLAENLLGGPKIIIQELTRGGSDIGALIDLVKTAERMFAAAGGAGTGSQKLTAVMPDALAIVSDVEVLAGVKISSIVKDLAEFNAGVQDLIKAVVRILNACGE